MKNARGRMNHTGLLIFVIAVLSVLTAFSHPAHAAEQIKYVCSFNPFETCYVSENAITIKGNGQEIKGHLIGSYSCIHGKCMDDMSSGSALDYNCSMDDLDCFCKLIKPNGCPAPGKWNRPPGK